MNSILHTCTHSNDDTFSRLTDDQMYAAIFSYIEHLFEIIKPHKVFYMAIDGVAPRAKMNQQRARRFRTAFEAEENMKNAIEKGLEIPKDDPFDSNAITPGTEFMAKLTDNLKYFIHKKISEDSRWANVKIILSGHEVPGEGEHKIMEYIRTMKNQPNHDPNSRHCIYGLDADLIMLGLVSHYPHFALLREEVTFGPRGQKQSNELTDQNFYLLHLSLLREYLSLEFQNLDNQLSFEYNFERVLDDFILIMYVIGNDFLPNLPDLFINKGAFPLLLETFKQTLQQSDGYLNENGTINLKRLNIWLNFLSEFELENFEKQDVDVEWFNKRLEDISITGEKKRERMGKLLILKDQKKLVGMIKPWLLENSSKKVDELVALANEDKLPQLKLPTDEATKDLEFLKTFALDAGIVIIHSKSEDTFTAKLDIDGLSPYETEEEHNERLNELRKIIKKYQSANLFETDEILKESKDIYDTKFMNWKDKYYKEKLHFSIYETDKMVEFTQHYLEGLQWVLYYYYKGCPSWNWYFRYHYSPRISDISIGLNEFLKTNTGITFEKSKPFKPFEQLMAVLPARSRKLMPLVYRPLMTDPHSPIIDFYPHEVDIDKNGKSAPWEAVVLLSFVDENRLIDALKPIEAQLSPEELKRNSIGKDIEFIFNPQIDYVYPTPLPGYFHDLEHDKCIENTFLLPTVEGEVKIELGENALLGKDSLAGFPTLETIPFNFELSLHEIKVFQNPSRSESMILSLENMWDDLSIYQFSQKFVNKVVYTKWPFLRESRVVSVMDREFKYESLKIQNSRKVVSTPLSQDEAKSFYQTARSISDTYEKTKGIQLGDIEGLVYVQPVTGLIRNEKGAYVKTFSKDTEIYPIQLVVEEVTNEDARFATRPPLPIDEEFPLESQVVFLGAFAYGTPATVAGYTGNDKVNVKISKIQSTNEPNIGKRRLDIENKEIRYLPSFEVSKKLRLNALFMSKITSGYMLENDFNNKRRVNIGLELKFEGRRQKVLGFTRKDGKVWEFSPLAIQLITDYRSKFPKLFKSLQEIDQKAIPKASSVLNNESELQEVTKWLKDVKAQLMKVSLESESFTKFSFEAIESYMEHYIGQTIPYTNKDIKGVPKSAVLDPSESYQLLSTQRFELGDRIIYVQKSGKVPYLSKGTVASITSFGPKNSLGVIFDYPLMSGNNMNGKLKTNRGLIVDSSLVLNITNKQLVYHSKASKQKSKPLDENEKKQRSREIALAKKQKQELENAKKQANSEKTNELLNLLKKSDRANKSGAEEAKLNLNKEAGDKNENSGHEEELRLNSNAIRHIYGQIYSNVMNEGAIPPQQMPYGVPVVPGIPLPPQFFQQPPNQFQQQPQPPALQAPSQQQQEQNPSSQQSSQNRENGRNERGRGNRGNYRGNGRGRGRGGRGRGKPN
ncbi:uncharacterized protein AC631_03249 [Debaryomyces fabryi]|uniref:5'-3' exoribonuclease 1 n=1 Tax=Debaryomyces fabryi TaxID=58627 RepID=A0A0V1PXT6_9ASCO|nr:uncharacterized protein AC631_03249 [Debaryomyces fabryi]KSA00998.1 hypothetical protein AC631_03249 [Debaryomyces fabryi]CUM55403.1 unnamed protein product [Debaryomyces fabryi]